MTLSFAEELDELVTKHFEYGEESLDSIISELELKVMALQEEEEEG